MFESAEIGHRLGKRVFREREPGLRSALLDTQYALLAARKGPVVILVNGIEGAGKGETVNLLNEWMDPRHIRTEAFGPPSDDESARPEMWRYWQSLPARGRIGILFGSWYTEPILARVMGEDRKARFHERLEQIRQFERMLVAEGGVLVKLWFHLPKDVARQRQKELRADRATRWRVSKEDRERLARYDDFAVACEEALRRTSTGDAPWHVIEGTNPEYRALTVGETVLDAMKTLLAGERPAPPNPVPPPPPPLDGRTLLASFDYGRSLTRKRYEAALAKQQARIAGLCRDPRLADRAIVVAFEGMDAAGKGSTIRRVTQALDARHYHVIPIAAPTEEERAHPYLWRFWRHVPPHGRTTLFDRSWYGRVLVERVEGFCSDGDWMRGYDEINAFEEQLVRAGVIVVKFWMAITADEQLRRFRERQQTPHKNFKITDEDWRNRDKWPLYERAVGDMIDRTSTDLAPWHVVASDDKLWARIEVLTRLADRLEHALAGRGRGRG